MDRGSITTTALLVASALLAGLAPAITARAGELTLEAADVAVIQDPENLSDQRILLRFPLPELLSGARIDLAIVECPVQVSCPDTVAGLVANAFMLTTAWDGATADWSVGWTTPGGDMDRTQHAAGTVACVDTATVRFDATGMIRAWASGESQNHGLISTVARGQSGSTAVRAPTGRRSTGPEVLVWYTPDE